jgi:S-adenosylmethionine-dependent methyltransferase
MHLIDALYKKALSDEDLTGFSVLDAAGGMGQMSHWFLENGASVEYFDVSQEMVETTRNQLSESVKANKLSCHQASIVDYHPEATFDFVNAHAVLEWLEDPMGVLPNILNWVKPGGYIGLMVYNKHMLMLRHMIRGTLGRAMSGDIAGDKRGLTPISPLDPHAVRAAIESAGFEVVTYAGIRSFSDLAEKTVIDWYGEAEVFNAELSLCEQRPYCDLARYVLIVARRNIG